MTDLQEPAEVAGMSNPQDDTGAPQKKPEQTTAIVNEDMDSRTSFAGRKRNLQESTHGDKADSDGENDERLRKRVKDHQDPPLAEVGLATGITSPPVRGSSPIRVEAETGDKSSASDEPSVFRLLQVESEKSQAPGAESHSLFSLEGKGFEAQEPAPASIGSTQPVAMPPSSWNGGISSGLRTSFGSKPRLSFGPKSTPTPAISLEDTTTQLADSVGGSSATSSALSTNVNSPVVAPFKELTREEQDNLSGEEKSLYLKSLFAQLRGPTPSKGATPPVTRDASAIGRDSRYFADGDDNDLSSGKSSTEGQNQDVPFEKLTNAARRRLSPEDRAEYDAAYIADKRERKEQRLVRKAARQAALIVAESEYPTGQLSHDVEEKSLHQNTITSDDEGDQDREEDTAMNTSQAESKQNVQQVPNLFQKLTKRELRLLNKEERAEYNRVLNAHLVAERQAKNRAKKEAKRQREEELLPITSHQAEAAIARGYPLSANDAAIRDKIWRGETYYPRRPEKVPFYQCGVGTWDLHEVFAIDGKPLPIQDFSFNSFAPVFLSRFPNDWSKMNRKTLVGAFGVYLPPYYKHVGIDSPAFLKCRATATQPNAITVEEAQVLASRIMGWPDQSQRPETLPKVNDASIPEVDIATQDEVDIIMDDVETSIAPADDQVDIELHQAELYLQQRYYPSSDLNILRCLACSKTGHNTLECPLMTCEICQTSGVHSEAMCPQKKRCDKCRDRGHKTENCKEKLSLPKSEMSCDICNSSDHLEMACHYVWRSFDLQPEEIFTVRDIPVNCYNCGYSGHFGSECGLHRGVVYSGGLTWSKHNLNIYVDPSSNNRALSAGKDYSIPARGPKKGNANDPITIDDESDAEASFIRPKVLPSHPKGGKIQVQPIQQKQQPQKRQKKKKNKNKQPEPAPDYHRNLNPPRASRPDFGPNPSINNPPQNPPSGPRGGGQNNLGNANRGGSMNRGGRGGGLSRADRRRMADQAGARAAAPGGF